MNLRHIALSNLVTSGQPRPLVTQDVDKLASSIKEIGLIQPITVTATTVMRGIAEPGYRIVAGHHRVAACRALGWTEIEALVISGDSDLQSELIEIDENLCRAELTASQRTSYTKRRRQIWEALHPEEIQVRQAVAPVIGYASPPPQTKGFAASTADITGESVRGIQRHIARAEALGDDTLTKVTNTSLDSGVELDALAKLPTPERAALIERAVAGERVSARTQDAPVMPSKALARTLPMRLYRAVHDMVHGLGFPDVQALIEAIADLPELTPAEDSTLNSALDIFQSIGELVPQVEKD